MGLSRWFFIFKIIPLTFFLMIGKMMAVISMKMNNILIIEDDLQFSQPLAKRLESDGFKTKQVSSSHEALNVLANFKPKGVILDLQLTDEFTLNLLNLLKTKKTALDYVPFIIVLSHMINADMLKILKKYQVPYYNKSSQHFNQQSIVDAFKSYFYFDNVALEFEASNLNAHSPKDLNTADLNFVVHKFLSRYHLKIDRVAYGRLIEIIIHLVENQSFPKLINLTLFSDESDYHNTYKGIGTLIKKAYDENPEPFFEFFHKKTEAEVKTSGSKLIPTTNQFIYHVVSEIRNILV